MRKFQLAFALLFVTTIYAFAQPSNDNCGSATDLGTAPICQNDQIFTNLNATASANPVPGCFTGGQRDVWFQFTTSADIDTYVISVKGVEGGGTAMRNPQIAIYRGTCTALSLLECASAENGASEIEFATTNLRPNRQYFIRVNDYSATATPNAGNFTLCIDQFRPAINMGEQSSTTACRGTLFDSGGPDDRYGNNEDLTFQICPDEPSDCILIELESYDMEIGSDFLSVYAGANINAPLITRFTGTNLSNVYPVQAESECVTIQFESDFLIRRAGFELTWQCESAFCFPTSLDRITDIPSLPFSTNSTTCGVPATFSETPCGQADFLNGPEKIFQYESPGGICAKVDIINAAEGTGVIVLDGLPDDPSTTCVGQSIDGTIRSANLQNPGTYYFIVANGQACTAFDINIEPTECLLSPSLTDALCNPFNGCINEGGTPSNFIFQDGFQDVLLRTQINSGCWLDAGEQADFFWFTIEAQADGPFGFILSSGDTPSDIDFNVWGPFTSEQACDDKAGVIEFISNNQPIRSSWSPTPGQTGLAARHPIFRYEITDDFDCFSPNFPSQLGDDFVRPIAAQQGEVYVILVNDYGNAIQNSGINIDWSPSDPAVLDRLPIVVETTDLEICQGESTQIIIDSNIDNISWSPSETLSCSNCLNPIATPTETTVYTAIVQGICTIDTVTVEVEVIGVDLEEEITTCFGEEFELNVGDFQDVTIAWDASPEVLLSCTDCPNPTVTTTEPGTFFIVVNLITEECPVSQTITLTVLNDPAPNFEIVKDQFLCADDTGTIQLGNAANDPFLSYTWTLADGTVISNDPNPTVDVTAGEITYFVEVTNGVCPTASLDSIKVEAFTTPVSTILSDTTICLGSTLTFGLSEPEDNTTYEWMGVGQANFADETDLNTTGRPRQSGIYTLVATRGACVETLTANINVTQANVDILPTVDVDLSENDTIRICLGDEYVLQADSLTILPMDTLPTWSSSNGSFEDSIGLQFTVQPTTLTTYFVEINNMGCRSVDAITIAVDSLPQDLSIEPQDTMICEGGTVILRSPFVFEPSNFPVIDFNWIGQGQQTPDSLYNLVVIPDTTTTYFRETTNGACFSLDSSTVFINPNPIVAILPENPIICPGESVQLTVSPTEENEAIIESYEWSPMEGLSCGDCFDPTASSPGVYNVEVMSDKMCPGSASVEVRSFSDPVIAFPAPPVICQGEEIQLNSAFTPSATYTWTNAATGEVISNDPLPVVSPAFTTTYRVSATNGNCPPIEREVTIQVITLGELMVTEDLTVCLGEDFTLSADAGSSGTYRWLLNNQVVSTGQQYTTSSFVASTLNFEVEFISEFGCGELFEGVSVEVQQTALLDSVTAFVNTTIINTIFIGSDFDLEAFLSPNSIAPDGYNWYIEDELIAENAGSRLNITADQLGNIVYSVEAVSSNGCPSERIAIVITVLPVPEPQAPNIFTPNGDNLNDIFRVLFPSEAEFTDYELRVYSRWGNLVFETTNIDEGWDGKFNGEFLPSDNYMYYYNYTNPQGETRSVKGEILLMR